MAKKKKTSRVSTTLGTTYRGVSTGVILGTNAAVEVYAGRRDPKGILASYRTNWKENLGAIAVHVADEALGQKLLGHNSALGRGSATAWAAEAIASGDAILAGTQKDPGLGTARYTINKTGFAPGALVGFHPEHPQTRLYYGAKVIGGIARKVSQMNLIQPVARPVKKMLGSMGGAL